MPSKIWTPLDPNQRPVEIDQVEMIIRKSLVGQDRAVKQALKIFNRMFSGIRPYDSRGHRPLGTFMFLGPTGVGKTLLAEEIARVVTGQPSRSDHHQLRRVSRGSRNFQTDRFASGVCGFQSIRRRSVAGIVAGNDRRSVSGKVD